MADLAKEYSFDECRVTHAQNIVLPHVRKADLYTLWQKLDAAGLGTANLDQIGDIIACPGLDYCSLANARSIPVAQKISERMAAKEQEIGELKLKISGCINACGHHHVGHIGILGLEKSGAESYQITLGGDASEKAAIGDILGPGLAAEQVPDAIERLVEVYLKERQAGEVFIDAVRRLGAARRGCAALTPPGSARVRSLLPSTLAMFLIGTAEVVAGPMMSRMGRGSLFEPRPVQLK